MLCCIILWFLMFFLYRPGEGALCSIPIENILAVERLEEESFKMKNVRCQRLVGRNVALQVCWLLSHFLSHVPDVPGYSARASPLHPGQQLRRGPRLDWHPDQSQSVQPQTLKHLPSFSLPQRPLALLQALSGHRPWVHALHWVRKRWSDLVQQHVSFKWALSFFHLFPVVCRQTSSWTWMETERLRGFIPCSAHTCPKWSRCKVRPQQECLLLIPSFLCSCTTLSPSIIALTLLLVSSRRGLWQ